MSEADGTSETREDLKFIVMSQFVLEKILDVFYYIGMTATPPWSCDLNHSNILVLLSRESSKPSR